MSNLTENIAFVERWADYTSQLLSRKRKQLKIYVEGELDNSFGHRITTSGSTIKVEFYFLSRGRYVDMGAGRKPKISGRYQEGTEAPKGRKPKKWYSKPFYGRLNSLNEALSAKVAEEVLNTNAQYFKQRGSIGLIIAQ